MKRLNLNDPEVWNKWRALYFDLTEKENIQFGYDIFEKYPNQQSFTLSNYKLLEQEFVTSTDVLEIGGWRGELAAHILAKNPTINTWKNIDVCKAAIDAIPATNDKRLHQIYPYCFEWWVNYHPSFLSVFNYLVMAHSIEHLHHTHVDSLMQKVAGIRTIIIEAPISEHGDNWHNYQGTHIFDKGWGYIDSIMRVQGRSIEVLNESCRIYTLR